ncbi:hypothetical protein DSO57_1021518 [Entomophthora muscae]|uniref:Uncharacterized protein n=1 Tax=Entomophthora muscae TaxID=34485 RepID=A0ACC2RUM3_9FUNG|nr:hypothetical protein DSO57_1021518 [Entomophthora muscae]
MRYCSLNLSSNGKIYSVFITYTTKVSEDPFRLHQLMNSNYSSKGERRVARDDWKELVDESLIALWPKSSHQTPNMFHGPQRVKTCQLLLPQQKEPFDCRVRTDQERLLCPIKSNLLRANMAYSIMMPRSSMRRRIRLASDFDEMLKRGFPTFHRPINP